MSNTHRAVIETSVPPGIVLVAAGPKEFCIEHLDGWVKKFPLSEYEVALLLEVVEER